MEISPLYGISSIYYNYLNNHSKNVGWLDDSYALYVL